MGLFKRESTWDKVTKPLGKVDGRSVARSGLRAGASMVTLAVISAATSAARRRAERS